MSAKIGPYTVHSYDRVTYRRPDGRIAAGTVNPLLVFPSHVVLNIGNNGIVIDEHNIVGVRHKTKA